jgi:hypothetical protein
LARLDKRFFRSFLSISTLYCCEFGSANAVRSLRESYAFRIRSTNRTTNTRRDRHVTSDYSYTTTSTLRYNQWICKISFIIVNNLNTFLFRLAALWSLSLWGDRSNTYPSAQQRARLTTYFPRHGESLPNTKGREWAMPGLINSGYCSSCSQQIELPNLFACYLSVEHKTLMENLHAKAAPATKAGSCEDLTRTVSLYPQLRGPSQ